MKTRPLAVALLLSLAPVAAFPPRVALAQAGADDATTKMARARFQEGVAFFDKGQFEMARAAFLQAYALRKHPTVLLNLAQSSLKSGHALEAARYFQQFLKDSGTSEAQRADASHGLGEARMKLGRIDVIGAATGADVFVDEERIGMAPLDHSVDVEPGSHSVRTQGANGEQTVNVTASVGQGVVARFNASAGAGVPAAPPPPAPAEPTPEPASPPPAEPTPSQPPPPPSEPPAETGSGRSHPWGWVIATGVVTAAGFGVAAGFAASKSSAQNSANQVATAIIDNGGGQGTCYVSATTPTPTYAQACSALATDNNNVNADATVANIGIAVGLVGLAGLIVSVIFTATSYSGSSSASAAPTRATDAGSFTVTPLLGKGTGGIGFGGSF